MVAAARVRIGEALGERRNPLLLVLITTLAYLGVAVIRPGLPQKLAFVDPLILALCVYSLVSMMYKGSPATSGALRLLPWIWLILLGSFLGLGHIGITNWALQNLSRTVFALLTFICMWHLVAVAKLQRAAIVGTALGVFLTATSLLINSSKYRAAAFFQHPNYAGHYMAIACMVLIVVARRWYWKAATVVALAIALMQTSSFGAMAMVVAMCSVYAVRALTRNTAILAAALAMLVIGGLFLATPQAADLVPNDTDDWAFSESISSERLERSGDTRLILWSQAIEAYIEEPLGIGPDGVRRLGVAKWNGQELEIHSDGLGYLVERGVVGLVGFIGLWAALFLVAKKGGLARVLIVGILVQGLFRETMHYRHMWILLALAFAIDYARGSPGDDEDAVEAVEPVPERASVKDPLSLTDPYFLGEGHRAGT